MSECKGNDPFCLWRDPHVITQPGEANVAERVREACAKVCERRAQDRFEEHGYTEPDTNASYYVGEWKELGDSLDEEDSDCAKAIRALDLSAFSAGAGQQNAATAAPQSKSSLPQEGSSAQTAAAPATAGQETPVTDAVDSEQAPDTNGHEGWKVAYFSMLTLARSLERRLREAEKAHSKTSVVLDAVIQQRTRAEAERDAALSSLAQTREELAKTQDLCIARGAELIQRNNELFMAREELAERLANNESDRKAWNTSKALYEAEIARLRSQRVEGEK